VVAYVRSPEKLNSQEKLTIIQGTLEETTKLQQAMLSCDAVLVALGNPIKDSSADLFASFMPRLIKIMRLADVSRIIVLSSLGTGETIRNVTYPYKIGVQTFLKGNQADHEKGERHLIASNLNWTLIYPGPLFDGPKTEHPLVRNAASGYKMPGAPRTNRADVAAVMLSQLNREESYQQKLLMCSKQEK
jgi:putative NADH-flavin reductase